MAEYIDKQLALESLLDEMCMTGYQSTAMSAIKRLPTADVAPVRHGRWIMSSDRPDTIICTLCDTAFDVWKHESKDFFYCPHCGCKMDKEADDAQ